MGQQIYQLPMQLLHPQIKFIKRMKRGDQDWNQTVVPWRRLIRDIWISICVTETCVVP